MRKNTIEDMQQLARKRGGKCLSTAYINNCSKLLWQCAEGHQWPAIPRDITTGNWCSTCYHNNRRDTLEDMQRLARKRGGKCLSTEYINNHSKLLWQCREGHQWPAVPNNISKGSWCPVCAGNTKNSIEHMQEIAAGRGGKCLSTEYISNKTKLLWQCQRGHKWKAVPANIKTGQWCPRCADPHKGRRGTLEQMQQLARDRGGLCLSTAYVNTTSKLLWQCHRGHKWKAVPHNIKKGRWCPRCAGK
jgi:succinate dehydrogenase flavin-adding protein (antitoxin of CptAB toxin-antitoxin module)